MTLALLLVGVYYKIDSEIHYIGLLGFFIIGYKWREQNEIQNSTERISRL